MKGTIPHEDFIDTVQSQCAAPGVQEKEKIVTVPQEVNVAGLPDKQFYEVLLNPNGSFRDLDTSWHHIAESFSFPIRDSRPAEADTSILLDALKQRNESTFGLFLQWLNKRSIAKSDKVIHAIDVALARLTDKEWQAVQRFSGDDNLEHLALPFYYYME